MNIEQLLEGWHDGLHPQEASHPRGYSFIHIFTHRPLGSTKGNMSKARRPKEEAEGDGSLRYTDTEAKLPGEVESVVGHKKVLC